MGPRRAGRRSVPCAASLLRAELDVRSCSSFSVWSLLGLTGVWLVGCAGGDIGDPPGDFTFETPVPPFSPAPGGLRRLTVAQYRNAIHDVLGEHIVVPASLEPDLKVEGLLAVGASRASISNRGVEQYEDAAYGIAEQAFQDQGRDTLVPCAPAAADDATCAEATLQPLGERLWRRALTVDESALLVRTANEAGLALGDFYAGLEYGLALILQSPYFLYRVEVGEPTSEGGRFGGRELATRLAFFLWNSLPDDALIDAAKAGELATDDGLRAQVDRMLADDRARDGAKAFFSDMLDLELLDDLRKDPSLFTHFSAEVGPAARQETLRTFEWLVFDADADYRDLFTTRTTFVDRRLAAIYTVAAPEREGFGRIDLPDGPRAGLLGHVSVLAMNSHPSGTSATLRGQFIRRTLMCGSIPPPPTNVDTSLPEPSGTTLTLRDRVAEHLVNPSCAACHKLMDPIGLGLERFDGLGRYRETDSGATIDASGELAGMLFEDAVGLGHAVAASADTAHCLVRTMLRYATGHVETTGETKALRELERAFEESGYRVQTLMAEVAMSRAFREVAVDEVAR